MAHLCAFENRGGVPLTTNGCHPTLVNVAAESATGICTPNNQGVHTPQERVFSCFLMVRAYGAASAGRFLDTVVQTLCVLIARKFALSAVSLTPHQGDMTCLTTLSGLRQRGAPLLSLKIKPALARMRSFIMAKWQLLRRTITPNFLRPRHMPTAASYLDAWRSAERAVCSELSSDHFFAVEQQLLNAPILSGADAKAVLEVKAHAYQDEELSKAVARVGAVS